MDENLGLTQCSHLETGCNVWRTECFPSTSKNTLPYSFGSSWKNLPPNFFGKKDESKQMKKGEGGANLRQAPEGMCSPLPLITVTSQSCSNK